MTKHFQLHFLIWSTRNLFLLHSWLCGRSTSFCDNENARMVSPSFYTPLSHHLWNSNWREQRFCEISGKILGGCPFRRRMSEPELTQQLNSMEDTSRLYQTIQDNKSSRIKELPPLSLLLQFKTVGWRDVPKRCVLVRMFWDPWSPR